MNVPEYSERIVAFLDILGFGALVRQLDSDPSLHSGLHRALSKIRVFKHSSLQQATAQSDLELSVFSDSIVISGTADNLHGVIFSAIHLQANLLEMGILVRGGISSGRTVHADDILYGEGMPGSSRARSERCGLSAHRHISEISRDSSGLGIARCFSSRTETGCGLSTLFRSA